MRKNNLEKIKALYDVLVKLEDNEYLSINQIFKKLGYTRNTGKFNDVISLLLYVGLIKEKKFNGVKRYRLK